MKNLSFVLWMVLFPISIALQEFIIAYKYKIRKKEEKQYKEDTELKYSIFVFVFWIWVGCLLYEE